MSFLISEPWQKLALYLESPFTYLLLCLLILDNQLSGDGGGGREKKKHSTQIKTNSGDYWFLWYKCSHCDQVTQVMALNVELGRRDVKNELSQLLWGSSFIALDLFSVTRHHLFKSPSAPELSSHGGFHTLLLFSKSTLHSYLYNSIFIFCLPIYSKKI